MLQHQKHYMRGDAMLVLVIILAIALLGAVGFIAWQNFGSSKVTTTEDNTTLQDKEQEKTTKPTEKVLTFSEWGVEMPLVDGMDRLTVTRPDDDSGGDGYEISVAESFLFDDPDRVGTQTVGWIGRYNATDDAGRYEPGITMKQAVEQGAISHAAVVGDYVYIYSARQATVYAGDTDAEIAADKKLEELSVKTVANQVGMLRETK